MSEYLEHVLKASGGHAAPAENLDLPEEYSDEFEEFDQEDLSFLAEIQELDDNSDFDDYDPILSSGLVPEEKDLADAILEVVEKYGKFNDDNTGVWAGYESAEVNAENAAIGVKCGNCVFWEAPNGCKIIQAETEEGGLCRFAILPDGAVTADADYGDECPPATQDIQLNLENRQNAIENVGYGPLNPAEPNEEFWQEKADRWKTTIEEAKTAVCGNCIFFIRTPKVLDCLETGIGLDQEAEGTIAAGELGYCSALDFKCASERTCNAWAAGGPITEETEGVTATAGSKPAPKKDRIYGSKKNKKGSAATGKGVKFSKKIEEALSEKVKKHNEDAPDGRKTSLRTLKAVYRRGAGAFSTSHRPDQNRNSWAMARVNAFLKLLKSGKPKNAKYTTDNDLLPASHPRSSKTASAAVAASASLETANEMDMELSNDPCWDGYVQVGMKEKNGKRVPNCVPSSAAIDNIVASYSAEYARSRHISNEDAYAIARQALDKYEYLEDNEVYSAIIWELTSFLEYALTGEAPEDFEAAEFSSFLPEGHPARGDSSLTASIEWLAGDPVLDNSARAAILTAFSDASDYVSSLHSSARLRAMASSGALPERTVGYLISISQRYAKVN